MRSLIRPTVLLTLLSISCGADPKPPTVEPPPRIVVVSAEEIVCDLTGVPAPEPKPDFERPSVEGSRTCQRTEDFQAMTAALAAERRRRQALESCWRRYEAAQIADEHLTSADAGVE